MSVGFRYENENFNRISKWTHHKGQLRVFPNLIHFTVFYLLSICDNFRLWRLSLACPHGSIVVSWVTITYGVNVTHRGYELFCRIQGTSVIQVKDGKCFFLVRKYICPLLFRSHKNLTESLRLKKLIFDSSGYRTRKKASRVSLIINAQGTSIVNFEFSLYSWSWDCFVL